MREEGLRQPSIDVLVIGAGQAGLAMGYFLRQAGYDFKILERHARIGETWRRRYDSLVLFSSREMSRLPGMKVPGDQDGYPTKDEMADYLETYARRFALPLTTSTTVERLERTARGFRARTTEGETIDARAVVVATGAFQIPNVPSIAGDFAEDVPQLTSSTYRRPSQLPDGDVLVVGDGATGRQVARELVSTHRVYLATGKRRNVNPQRIFGKDYFWWLDKLGLLKVSRESLIGRIMMWTDPFPSEGLSLKALRRLGVETVGRLEGADGRRAYFAKHESARIDAVIWAIGYREDHGWIDIPEAKDAGGRLDDRRGVTPVDGLYLLGRCWQWTRGSATVVGVGSDAAYIAECIARHMGRSAAA